MATYKKWTGQYAESLRRLEESCVQPKGLKESGVFSQQMKRWRRMPTELIRFYMLLSYSSVCYFYCKKSNRFELWRFLYKYIDSRSIHGCFLPDVLEKTLIFWVFIQVQINIPNSVQFDLCASSVFPHLQIFLCNSLISNWLQFSITTIVITLYQQFVK